MLAEVFGLTQQILMLISAYINTGVCGKLRIFGKTATMVFLVFSNHMTTAMTSLQLASFWILP